MNHARYDDEVDMGTLVDPRNCESALILNKMVGTGIFVSPSVVLAATGSKGMSLILWLVGSVMTWAGWVIAAADAQTRFETHC